MRSSGETPGSFDLRAIVRISRQDRRSRLPGKPETDGERPKVATETMNAEMIRQRAQSNRASVAGVIRGLWSYRRLVVSLVRRDLQQRSTKAIGGHAWLVIQPAIQILIYTVIFGAILGARLPGVNDRVSYGLFLCAGIIHWTHFSDLLTQSQSMFLSHADLIKTLRVPRSVLPLSIFVSSLVNYAIIAGLFLVALAVLGKWPGVILLAAIPLIVLQSLIALALGVLSGSINVFFRDVGQATPMILQLWFWSTPIVYPASILPERVHEVFTWNPLYAVVVGYQRIVIERAAPVWSELAIAAIVAVVLAISAWLAFRALSADIVDEL
jgi:lipopolysaccharide transport system permease protein